MTALDGRCGTCARFVRVHEHTDDRGVTRRAGECLLEVWSPPIFENNTCSQYLLRGTFAATVQAKKKAAPFRPRGAREPHVPPRPEPLTLPEDLLSMDADEFRNVLRSVLRAELGLSDVELGGRWQGGEVVLVPGKEGTQEKRIPLESLFHKIVMIRDRLRVLEQKVNAHPKLSAEEKVTMQQYVTQCYGSLTTFNVLFADKDDAFVGQKGD